MKRSPMPQRSKPMSRGKALARSGRLSPRNRTRSTAARAQDFGEEAATVRLLPCTVLGCCVSPCQPAHVKSRGAGGGRFDIVPLCHDHHREQHRVGIKTFAAKHALDLRAEADRIALAHSEPLGIRGLARRWAAHIEGPRWAFVDSLPAPLDDHERAALLGWVRRRLECQRAVHVEICRDHAGEQPMPIAAHMAGLANALRFDLPLDAEAAMAICEAAGWLS
jgi:hypothetical protein